MYDDTCLVMLACVIYTLYVATYLSLVIIMTTIMYDVMIMRMIDDDV